MVESTEKLISIEEVIQIKESEIRGLEDEITKQNEVLKIKELELEELNQLHAKNSELLDESENIKYQIDNSQKTLTKSKIESIKSFLYHSAFFAAVLCILFDFETGKLLSALCVPFYTCLDLYRYLVKTKDLRRLVKRTDMDSLISDIDDKKKKNEELENQKELKESEAREVYEKLEDLICSKKAKENVIEKLKFMQNALIEKIAISTLRTDAEERTLKNQILSEKWPELNLKRKNI